MAIIDSIHNPSFCLFPINNNRTGWRPFGAPVILVVPHRRTINGTPLANSQVFNVKVFIEDVPRNARVAGHNNVGLRFPDKELFSVTIDSMDLADRLIKTTDYDFYRSGQLIEESQATLNDYILYTSTTGVTDQLPFIPGANYYDLSDIVIDFEHLPSDNYNLVYQAEYFTRILSEDAESQFLCLSTNTISVALLKFQVRHPGVIIEEFERHTPAPYLTNAERSKDTTLALYRPFTDSLENIYDEQQLLESINWVYDAPPEVIPYISQLLGWDLPYFPRSLDKLRRAVLRRTVEFQHLSGTKRAVIELFRLFGFEILISNLWWSSDGERLIRPDENQIFKYRDQNITTIEKDQIEVLLNNWSNGGFGVFNIPLLFRPQTISNLDQYTALLDGGDITITSYVVTKGSQAHSILSSIAQRMIDDPKYFGQNSAQISLDADGFYISRLIEDQLTEIPIDGYSKCLISGKLGQAVDEYSRGDIIPIVKTGLSFDRTLNVLSVTLNGDLNLDNQSVFSFATYHRYEYSVPEIIKDLQSNRFDVQIVTQELTEFADPVVLDFAIEFLIRIKAFHSLLNKIIFSIELNETYEVTDWCVGGEYTQRWDTDAGKLQVPPAIIPNLPDDITDCSKLDPRSLGYKESDILLRLRKLANLPEEFAAWKALDARADQPTGATRLALAQPRDSEQCKFTYLGQDRIVGYKEDVRQIQIGPSPNANSLESGFSSNKQESPIDLVDNGLFNQTGPQSSSNNDGSIYGSMTREFTQIRQPWCDLDGSTDYCYKGRVDDEILYRSTIINGEQVVFKPCSIDLGIGVYYTFPSYSTAVIKGVKKPAKNSRSQRTVFSGGATTSGQQVHMQTIQANYLKAPYDIPLDRNSMLSRLYRDYDNPQDYTLHYNDRITGDYDQRHNLALIRPTLNIQKPTLHLPGCRFARINALFTDFYHPEWDARPWDDDFSTFCGPKNICGNNDPNFLNSRMIVKDDGNEYLIYDNRPFQALGNSMLPDISSLGDHTLATDALFTEQDVIHEVYMQNADNGHECLQLETVRDYDTSVQSNGARPGILETQNPIFNSYSDCGTSYIDFADGYGCVYGPLPYDGEDLDKQGLFSEALSGLGLSTSITDKPSEMLIFLRSGIISEDAIRLDCGCLLAECNNPTDGYVDEDSICSANYYLDQLNNYDWDVAHILVNPTMKLVENPGICSIQLDGNIGSLLETI